MLITVVSRKMWQKARVLTTFPRDHEFIFMVHWWMHTDVCIWDKYSKVSTSSTHCQSVTSLTTINSVSPSPTLSLLSLSCHHLWHTVTLPSYRCQLLHFRGAGGSGVIWEWCMVSSMVRRHFIYQLTFTSRDHWWCESSVRSYTVA